MKIVMIADFFNEELDYQENLVARYYSKYGHQVVIITSTCDSVLDYISDSHDRTGVARTYVSQGVKIVRLSYRLNFLNRVRFFPCLDSVLEEECPAFIYAHDITMNFSDCVRYIIRHPDCRMIMDYHADYSNSGRGWLSLRILHGLIRKYVLDRTRPYLSRIFPVTPGSARFLKDIYGVTEAEMEILPLGADMDLGQRVRVEGSGNILRDQLGIPQDDIVIFTGGKLHPKKRTDLAIQAMAILSNPRVHLVIVGEAAVGDAEYRTQLQALGAKARNVIFAGWQERDIVFRYLAMADFALFPASQSILWQQAISMSLPLIVGDTGHQDITYLNGHGNIIILSACEINAVKIAEKVSILVTDSAHRRTMSEGATRVALEHLDWNRLLQRTLRYAPERISELTSAHESNKV